MANLFIKYSLAFLATSLFMSIYKRPVETILGSYLQPVNMGQWITYTFIFYSAMLIMLIIQKSSVDQSVLFHGTFFHCKHKEIKSI